MDNESEDSITIQTIPESIYSVMLLILTILQLVLATTLIAASESGNGNALKAIVVGPQPKATSPIRSHLKFLMLRQKTKLPNQNYLSKDISFGNPSNLIPSLNVRRMVLPFFCQSQLRHSFIASFISEMDLLYHEIDQVRPPTPFGAPSISNNSA